MVSLYRDPLGENIFSTNDHSSTVSVRRGGALVLRSKEERILVLEARIKELEDLLRERRVSHSTCSHASKSNRMWEFSFNFHAHRTGRVLIKGEQKIM